MAWMRLFLLSSAKLLAMCPNSKEQSHIRRLSRPEARPMAQIPGLPTPPPRITTVLHPRQIPRNHSSASGLRRIRAQRSRGARVWRVAVRGGRAARPGTVNWLWDEAAFMAYRDPLVVYVGYFLVHMAEPAI